MKEHNLTITNEVPIDRSTIGCVFLDSRGVERFPVNFNKVDDGWKLVEFVPTAVLKKIFGKIVITK